VALLAATRLSFPLMRELLRPPAANPRRVLIYGAGDGGELVLRELRKNPGFQREAIGFLDDDRSKVGTRIHDVPVLGTADSAEHLMAAHGIGEVIVSSEHIPRERIEELERACASLNVPVVRAAIRFD
jgi:UDP-GlcNAc:undecaprenyl-phosphate GlcNAc-1-phosphate transferase